MHLHDASPNRMVQNMGLVHSPKAQGNCYNEEESRVRRKWRRRLLQTRTNHTHLLLLVVAGRAERAGAKIPPGGNVEKHRPENTPGTDPPEAKRTSEVEGAMGTPSTPRPEITSDDAHSRRYCDATTLPPTTCCQSVSSDETRLSKA